MSRKHLQSLYGNITSLRKCGLAGLFILAALAAGVWGPAGSLPAAANDAPVISGNTATYSGNQQPDPIAQNNTDIYNIVVNNLSTNVGSSSTGTSISLTNTGADSSGANSQALSLTYTGGTYSLLGQNYGAYVNTTGGTGQSDGGAGGAGGTVNSSGVLTGVTIGTSGAIQVSGIGIGGFSYGGAGGEGKEESSGHVTGGTGGAGGAGGSVQITNNGPITTTGTGTSYGIYGQSVGGGGGTGGKASADVSCYGGTGGQGGAAGSVNITTNGVITTGDSYGIFAQSLAGAGGAGGEADAGGTQGWGGTGGDGGAGGSVTVTNNAAIKTGSYLGAYGINAMSNGGSGGQGGEGKNGPQSNGGDGGNGGKGGAVTVNCNAGIDTAGLALAVNAASNGGNGGGGGSNSGNEGTAANGMGGNGGGSGLVRVNVAPGVTLTGGIAAASNAGSGGTGSEGKAYGGGGGNGGVSGGVEVNCQGNIDLSTNICGINGIWAQSISGAGGAGGNATGSGESYGGDGGNGGAGAAATVTCSGSITISGDYLHGILAQSWGGAGGAGGNAGHNPGSAGLSGVGGEVTVNLGGSIKTVGLSSYGILAQSLGGAGGSSGQGTKIITYAANATNGADGGNVTINTGSYAGGANSSIATQGASSIAICGQSVGGGGGTGDSASGVIYSLGGSGGSSGQGGTVTVNNGSQVTTQGFGAHGIQAQSVGGSGGNGGGSVTVGAGVTLAMGGSGGDGGNGGQVNVITTGNSISTAGDFAHGILAESIGGGGGNGGYAASGGAGLQISMGGSSGGGGNGGEVNVGSMNSSGVITYCTSAISTTGLDSKGIFAQSVGGGGGNGGYSIAAGLASAPIAIGGTGGGGGAGGIVNVYNAGTITTSNHLSQGIFAQSVTDGGGNGGFSLAGNLTPVLSASFSVGGSGGSGGDGKAVTVYNTGSISTGSVTSGNGTQTVLGYKSCGIQAQSVGGSGGNGGWAAAGAISFSLPGVPASASMSVTVGGSGGSGGSGGNVSVYNLMPAEGSSSIQTIGDAAHGILAQSKGGSGGSGGGSVALSCDFSGKADYGFNGSAAVGGSGGSGGTGGQVTVFNENAITTYGAGSLGILAQSIGGNGGEGGWSLALGLSGSATETFTNNVSVAVGGPGGSGATGNLVQVTNTGAITTYGQSSIGIEAQSVGGNGGNGGWSVVADSSLGRLNSFNPSVSVGGNGGDGATGNTVTVTNGQSGATSGAITTYGDLAQGILAQSIGGGGGNGGATASFGIKGTIGSNDTLTLTPQVSVGGSGGTGNTGGQVTVNNYAAISTAGTKSYGIEAQSVGGGGGNGGNSHIMTLSTAATSNLSIPGANIQASAAVGGKGGNGNDGGTVTVNNYGGITTQGMQAYGIFAQSVGGGGGSGGNSYDFNVIAALSKAWNKNNNNSGRNYTESVSVGGNGGGASNGGTVTVNNSGAIKTYGSSAYGIFAQSVGGGGGAGGSASTGLTVPSSDYNSWKSWLLPSGSLTFNVGGDGGSCGDGKQVTVTNSGAITTSGDAAFGIYAQSLGGGGGVASYDQSQLFSDTNNNGGTSDTGIMPYQMQIGGTGGAAGDGGTVQVTNNGAISTSGNQATGIYAQSIGGGGGSASVLGGQYHNTNYKQYFTFSVDIGRSGGNGGSGGEVTVTNTAGITTYGNNANGIFAQSVGGAGGSGSEASSIIQGFLWNGSVWNGASGAGGAVNVSQTGTISTSGTDAHGIVAQSMAGNDKANNVTVTLNDPNYPTATPGNIIASGLGSCGIVAQSLGAKGNGTIGITINQPAANTGLVQGGHTGTVTNADGTTTTYNAYGVLILDGQNNTLTNHGAIQTLDGQTGTAVMVQASYGAPSWGDLTISNYSTITGSVNQGAAESTPMTNGSNMTLPSGHSTITFNNYAGATYNAGPVINLGGGTLSNGGVLSLGTVQSTLTGNFNNYIQPGSSPVYGTFQTTVNGDGTIGQLNVSGTANLGGTLQVLKGAGPFKDGTSSSFLTGTTTGNFTNLILPASTSLVNFTVKYTGAGSQSNGQAAAAGNAVQIVSHVKSHTTVAAGSTETRVGGYLDQLLAANPTGNIAQILAEIQNLAPSQFHKAFESLTPGIYGANTDTTFTITRQYNRTLQQRLESLRSLQGAEAAPQALSDSPFPLLAYNGSNAGLGRILGQSQDSSGGSADRLGVWMEGFGQWGSQGSVDNVSGYNYGLAGTGIGVDYVFNKNLILGANFGYSYSNLNMDNSVGNGRINSLYGSLYGTWFTDRAYVEGVFSYGNHQYTTSRRVNIGSLQSSNQSSHTGNAFAVLAEGGYKFPVQQWNLTPFASLSFCNLSEGRIEESGALAAMQVSSRSTNSLLSELGVRVDKSIQTSKGTLVPVVKASWQHDYGVSQNSLPFTLIGAPIGVTVTQPRVSQDRAVVRAGLTFKAKGGITSSIQYMGEVGEKTQNHGVIGQFRFSF